eukprot:Platyproteum_vivax@DN4742_c0_g1_i1.p1
MLEDFWPAVCKTNPLRVGLWIRTQLELGATQPITYNADIRQRSSTEVYRVALQTPNLTKDSWRPQYVWDLHTFILAAPSVEAVYVHGPAFSLHGQTRRTVKRAKPEDAPSFLGTVQLAEGASILKSTRNIAPLKPKPELLQEIRQSVTKFLEYTNRERIFTVRIAALLYDSQLYIEYDDWARRQEAEFYDSETIMKMPPEARNELWNDLAKFSKFPQASIAKYGIAIEIKNVAGFEELADFAPFNTEVELTSQPGFDDLQSLLMTNGILRIVPFTAMSQGYDIVNVVKVIDYNNLQPILKDYDMDNTTTSKRFYEQIRHILDPIVDNGLKLFKQNNLSQIAIHSELDSLLPNSCVVLFSLQENQTKKIENDKETLRPVQHLYVNPLVVKTNQLHSEAGHMNFNIFDLQWDFGILLTGFKDISKFSDFTKKVLQAAESALAFDQFGENYNIAVSFDEKAAHSINKIGELDYFKPQKPRKTVFEMEWIKNDERERKKKELLLEKLSSNLVF